MKSGPNHSTPRCHHCGASALRLAPGYAQALRVTSDCKPWPPGGVLALCETCGLVQTVADEQWRKDSEQIYAGYTIYFQSGGVEQATFDAATGAGQARSDAIIQALRSHTSLPANGRWLDVGCGNGALLRACSRSLPRWSLCGSEFNDKYRRVVEAIPGVERLITGALDGVPGTFDVISLIHVIEHIPGPASLLKELAGRLKPGGLVLLEVPDCQQNFFSLMTADHCSHFSAGMLASVAAAAGLDVLHAVDTWVAKEVTVVARVVAGDGPARQWSVPLPESERVFAGWTALQRVLAQAELLAGGGSFGIFGTSIAATWLDAQTGNRAKFFVDEDRSRLGKTHFGRPILAPAGIPDGTSVYMAQPPAIAGRLVSRLREVRPDIRFVAP